MKYFYLFVLALLTGISAKSQEMDVSIGSAVADGGSYNFGNVNIGSFTDHVFTITNAMGSTASLSITTPITVTGTGFSCTTQPAASVGSNGGTTTFTMRFTASSPAGAKTGEIVITNNDANENPYNINLSGTAVSTGPSITTFGTLSAFTTCAGTPSTQSSFTVFGSNLTADIIVTPPAGFEVSTTFGSGFASSITLNQSGGNVANTTIYVRLTSAASGSPSGNVTCASTGATTQNVAASGTVNALPTIALGAISSVSTSATSFSLPYTATTGSPNQYSITTGSPTAMPSFSAVTNASLPVSPISVTIPASAANIYNFIATVRNSTTGCVSTNTPFTLTTGVAPSSPCGIVATPAAISTTQVRAPNGLETYKFLRASTNILTSELTEIPNNSTITSFGFVFTGGANIAATGNLKVYMLNNTSTNYDRGTTWSSIISGMTLVYNGSYTLPTSAGNVDLELTTPFTYTGGSIYLAYDYEGIAPFAATPATYAANGNTPNSLVSGNSSTTAPTTLGNTAFRPTFRFGRSYSGPCITTTNSTSLTPFTTCAGSASTEQSFSVSALSLTNNITITPPAGFEISTTSGSNFTTSLSLTPTSGTVANTTIYVRLSTTATGTPNGNIAVASVGATTNNVAVSGTVNAAASITLGSNPSVCNGTTSANLTYSATTGSPNEYSIAWSAGAIIAGFGTVTNAVLPTSPISVTVPSNPGAGTYTGTLTVRNTTTGCSSTGTTFSVIVGALPSITLGSNPSICNGTTSANLTYSATTGSPNEYSIAWSAGAIIAGFGTVTNAVLPTSPISVTVPSNPGAGTYTGTLTVRNTTTGCSSTGTTFSVIVGALPSITLGSNPSICNGTTSANLTYSATTGSPNQYSIAWSAGAIIAGFGTVTNAVLPTSPISITVPSNPGAGTYTGTLTVRNTTTGCSSTGTTFSVIVGALPSITLGSNPSICNGTTSANLTYSATTGSPNQYSIAWSAGAIIAGFGTVTNAVLPTSPISITVPSNPGAGTYTGTLTVRNTTTGCTSTGTTFSVIVGALPSITLGSNPSVTNGTTNAN